MKTKRLILLVIIVIKVVIKGLPFFALLLFISPGSLSAQEESSFSVTPSIISITIPTKGEESKALLRITNHNDTSQTIILKVFPIKGIDKNTNRLIYQPISDLTNDQQSFYENAISLMSEGQQIQQIILSPKVEAQVELVVSYNLDQNQSEYYFTLGFLTVNEEIQKDISQDEITATSLLQSGVGSHVLISLGDRKSDLVIRDLTTDNFIEPILPTLHLSVENLTNKHNKIYASISVINMLGIEVANYPVGETYLLGNSHRSFEITDEDYHIVNNFVKSLSLGLNSIKLELYDVSNEKIFSRQIYYLALPLQGIMIVLITVLFLGYIIRQVKKRTS